jgi:biotin operon repressor
MLIGELFERDPNRYIEPIVKVDEHDPVVVRTELEEYVVTDDIRNDFSDIVDRFIERRSVPESVCGWISGFFGSGKSHFLKMLGYVLSNRPIRLESGTEIGAAGYFCSKHGISGGAILERELSTKALFINASHEYDISQEASLSRIVYRVLLREMGFSENFWIAEIERTLQTQGMWQEFLKFVEESEGRPWQEVRRMEVLARSILARGLHKLDSKRFTTIELAERSLADVRDFTVTPTLLAERLLQEAGALDKKAGRLVVLLDEVGLYVGDNPDRLMDLNALAEQITRIGKGKIWLIVTAQEALEEVIPKIEAYAGQFQKIRDRFQVKITLTPENIDTVVKKRLLAKSSEAGKLRKLNELYRAYSGSLATAALVKNPARDYRGLFTRLDQEEFVASYPLMPYHVRLMQEIFGLLRSRGRASFELTGQERAVLKVAQALIVGVEDRPGLADQPLGELATFDIVYDAIDEELKVVRSSEQAMIEKDIAELREREGMRVDSVAKTLYLLQEVRSWLPCTAENIAAVLYPRLGADKDEIESKVRASLDVLKQGNWVTEEDGKFRFLTHVERTFEQLVKGQFVGEGDRRELTSDVMKSVLKDLKTFNYKGIRTFNVLLIGDDEEVTSKGHLKLCFYSPLRSASQKNLKESVMLKSLANPDTVYWLSKSDARFERGLERAKSIEKALKEYGLKAPSSDELKTLDKYRRELDVLKNDDLPKFLVDASSSGTIVYQGQETVLDGKKNLQEVFNAQMRDLAEELFTEFSHAAFPIEKDAHIGSILTWTGGRLPKVYSDLQLVDDQDNILIDRPVASRVFTETRKRSPEGKNTGAELVEHFDSRPYGWDPRIVRLTLATLFKNGSIIVNLAGKEFLSPTETGSHEAFTNARLFNKARFLPGEEVTPEQRNLASQLISSIFGERGGKTIEEVDAALSSIVASRLEQCKRLHTLAGTINLPIVGQLEDLWKVLNEISDAATRSRRILNFIEKKRQATLSAQVPSLAKLLKFETDGNLSAYRRIRSFAREIAPVLLDVAEDHKMAAKSQSLRQGLEAQDFIERWPSIVSDYETLRGKYATAYHKYHARRTEMVQKAVESLKEHPAIKALSEDQTKQILSPLLDLQCDVKEPKAGDSTDFVCDGCSSSLRDLSHHLEMVEGRRRNASAKLGQILAKKKGVPVEVKGFSEEIDSVEKIPLVAGQLEEVSEKALKQGKRVKVDVKVK